MLSKKIGFFSVSNDKLSKIFNGHSINALFYSNYIAIKYRLMTLLDHTHAIALLLPKNLTLSYKTIILLL